MLIASPSFATCSREGERYGEEKDRRYRAMKKVSLNRQQMKRTVYLMLGPLHFHYRGLRTLLV